MRRSKIFNLSISEDRDKKVATIYLYGIIGYNWWIWEDEKQNTDENFTSILETLSKDYDRINVRINSPGGDVYHGAAIVSAIQRSSAEVHTYNDGLAASMGAVILCAAPEGRRHMATNAITMFHAPLSIMYGNSKEFRKEAEVLDKHAKALTSVIASATGKSVQESYDMFMADGEDHWMDYDECVEMGIVSKDDEYDVLATNVVDSLTAHSNLQKLSINGRSIAALFNNKSQNMQSTVEGAVTPPTEVNVVEKTQTTVQDAADHVDSIDAMNESMIQRLASLEQELEDLKSQNKKLQASQTRSTIVPATSQNNVPEMKSEDEQLLEQFNMKVSNALDRNPNFMFD